MAVLMASCINDDMNLCVFENRVFFDYVAVAEEGKGINISALDKINLYVFDSSGKFIKEYTDASPKISPVYHITLSEMPPGHYHLVAWGNLGEQYSVISPRTLEEGKSDISDLAVELTTIKDGVTTDALSPLFFATHKEGNTTEIRPLNPSDIRLRLVEDTYVINIEGVGLDSMNVTDYAYSVYISDNNSRYKFDNDYADSENFRYATRLKVEPEADWRLSGQLRVLRLSESRQDVTIKLINETLNTEIGGGNLIELIRSANEKGASLDLDEIHKFDLRFEFEPRSPLNCNVYINGYKVVDQNGTILD
jgi:hypothetical protein